MFTAIKDHYKELLPFRLVVSSKLIIGNDCQKQKFSKIKTLVKSNDFYQSF